MAKGSSNSSGGGSPKSKVFAALIVGMVLGLAIAGFIAWYVVEKSGTSFTKKEQRETPRPAVPATPAPVAVVPATVPATASGVSASPSYEFYKALPDKSESAPAVKPSKPSVAAPAEKAPAKVATDNATYFVQAGSFQNVADAEKLKAKLALVGMESVVQAADVPGKGMYHRVRLGPYQGLADANSAIANLKQNGVANATALHN